MSQKLRDGFLGDFIFNCFSGFFATLSTLSALSAFLIAFDLGLTFEDLLKMLSVYLSLFFCTFGGLVTSASDIMISSSCDFSSREDSRLWLISIN